jgi:chromosomal replication initiator protein
MEKVLNYMAIPGYKNNNQTTRVSMTDKEAVIKLICEHFEFSFDQILRQDRRRKFVFARNCLVYFLFKYTRMSKVAIGDLLERDHTSVIHSLKALQDLIDTEDEVSDTIVEIRKKLIS